MGIEELVEQSAEMELLQVQDVKPSITSMVELKNAKLGRNQYIPQLGMISHVMKKDTMEYISDSTEEPGIYIVETRVDSKQQFALLDEKLKKQIIRKMETNLKNYKDYAKKSLTELQELNGFSDGAIRMPPKRSMFFSESELALCKGLVEDD